MFSSDQLWLMKPVLFVFQSLGIVISYTALLSLPVPIILHNPCASIDIVISLAVFEENDQAPRL